MEIDSRTITVTCPKCSEEMQETLGRLKNDAHLVCSGCGQKIFVDAAGFRDGVASVEKSLDDLRRKLRDFGKSR